MYKIIIAFLSIIFISNIALARTNIRIVGSSTLYPYVTVVAERFGKSTQFKTPIVEATGTGGGVNLLCSGNSLVFPDIVNASRKIKASEIRKCRSNGVNDVEELLIGFDGVVLASSSKSFNYHFSLEELFLAVAAKVPLEGKLVDNFYKEWHQINKNFPKNKIEIYGPSFTSGTRDAFIDLIMIKYCTNIKEFINEYPKIEDRKAACKLIRRDGLFIDMGENDNVIIHKIDSNNNALGIIGYNFLEESGDKLKAAEIKGIAPNYQTIINKEYPISRDLFLYINKDHIGMVPGIKEFIAEFKSKESIGTDGYLTNKGFIAN